MSRNISEATKEDLDFLELQRAIREKIKDRKAWLRFIKYMKTYYE